MWDVECGMWNVGCEMWNVECGMWDVECGMWDVECGMWDVEFITHYTLHIPHCLQFVQHLPFESGQGFGDAPGGRVSVSRDVAHGAKFKARDTKAIAYGKEGGSFHTFDIDIEPGTPVEGKFRCAGTAIHRQARDRWQVTQGFRERPAIFAIPNGITFAEARPRSKRAILLLHPHVAYDFAFHTNNIPYPKSAMGIGPTDAKQINAFVTVMGQ